MFCPNCKTEYEDGIKICLDCGAMLVEELVALPVEVIRFKSKHVAVRFLEYLSYSGLEASLEYDEAEEMYPILADEERTDEVGKAFQGFFAGEIAQSMREAAKLAEARQDSSDEESAEKREDLEESTETCASEEEALEEAADNEHTLFVKELMEEPVVLAMNGGRFRSTEALTYTSASFKAKDNYSSAIMFIGVGIVGTVFVILCALGVLPLLPVRFTQIVMLVMFLGFLYIGIRSRMLNDKLEAAADAEDKLFKEIATWQKEQFSDAVLEEAGKDADSPEEKDILIADYVRTKTFEAFPMLSPDLLEHVVDTFLADSSQEN